MFPQLKSEVHFYQQLLKQSRIWYLLKVFVKIFTYLFQVHDKTSKFQYIKKMEYQLDKASKKI